MIEVRNVWKEYGEQVVLERLNLSIAQGEFCSMVGASGCGKSTFLRLLLGQERVDARRDPARRSSPCPANRTRIAAWCFNAIRYSSI